MFQRDYILRMIEMMGNLARKVAQLMEELEYLHQLDDASRLHCGMPLRALETLSVDSLCQMLDEQPRWIASELLYLRALERHVQWEARDEMLLKSLRLLASIRRESVLCELRAPRLSELKQRCLLLMTPEDLFSCALFFSEAERYDEMEDALFQALEASPADERRREWAAEGCRLLRQASQANGKALAFCRMTGEELMASAEELEMLFISNIEEYEQ